MNTHGSIHLIVEAELFNNPLDDAFLIVRIEDDKVRLDR